MTILNRRQWFSGVATTLVGCEAIIEPSFPRAPSCDVSCATVDIHCHVFNGSDLPISAFMSHVAPVPKAWTRDAAAAFHAFVNERAPSGSEELAELARLTRSSSRLIYDQTLVAPAAADGIARILLDDSSIQAGLIGVGHVASVAQLVCHPRYQVAAKLVETYPTVDLFTPLLVDYAYFAGADCSEQSNLSNSCQETPLHDQLTVHSAISVLSMHGRLGRDTARLHPFAPYNPLREVREVMTQDTAYSPFGRPFTPGSAYACASSRPPGLAPGSGALAAMRHAIEVLGFVGVKMYPPVGFLPLGNAERGLRSPDEGRKLDLALHAFYAYCEAEQVPITCHTSNANGYHLGYGMLCEPKNWEVVLARYPNLKINLGHFGHLEGLLDGDQRGLRACEAWMRQAAVLVQRYPHVYVDVANSPVPWQVGYAERFIPLLAEVFERYPRTRKRVMYGSDWWLNNLDHNVGSFVDAFADHFSTTFPDDRKALMGNNALTFLGVTKDDGTPDVENRNRLRLDAFYGQHGAIKPPWLDGSAGT